MINLPDHHLESVMHHLHNASIYQSGHPKVHAIIKIINQWSDVIVSYKVN